MLWEGGDSPRMIHGLTGLTLNPSLHRPDRRAGQGPVAAGGRHGSRSATGWGGGRAVEGPASIGSGRTVYEPLQKPQPGPRPQ